ncbi:cysteine desulfurase family protein [Cohnella faecalis]|uniref:cysteine desulfurase n=1 Tax=Cohnella faecalis TaxID=2315694 RepID=A0A398CK12_9BACL|nr:aminotransferase class V-fold PLP-dependent enzyme [Cohnella faecalis]RIE01529.1 aminotransferase class V-fold PLP-dependent enzyme [Cohnella faecalis]
MTIYLDFNATTPIDERVLQEMNDVYRNNFGNAGSRTHVYGQMANKLVEKSRREIALLLQVDSNEVIFTSGATESNNLTLLGLAEWGLENGRTHIISSQIEHKSILEPLELLSKKGFEIELVPGNKSGRIDSNEIIRRVRSDTLLVSMMHANNETGIIQPVAEVGDFLRETPTYFHIDAAQTFGKLVEELQLIHYDFLSVSAHKIFGPQGIGALVARRKRFQFPPIQPLMLGGGQEFGLRPGTVPVALVAGFGKASILAHQEYNARKISTQQIRESIISQLSEIPHLINGDMQFGLSSTLNVSFPGIDSEALMLTLEQDLALSNGSACTSKEYKPSHVLLSMGFDEHTAHSAIRLSWGYATNEVNLEPLIAFVKDFTN